MYHQCRRRRRRHVTRRQGLGEERTRRSGRRGANETTPDRLGIETGKLAPETGVLNIRETSTLLCI